jgi:hypothetical protein
MATTASPRRSIAPARRNSTPPAVARKYGVAAGKVIDWIESGQLAALNLATRPDGRPRYSISPEALDAFERARAVVPVAGRNPHRRD